MCVKRILTHWEITILAGSWALLRVWYKTYVEKAVPAQNENPETYTSYIPTWVIFYIMIDKIRVISSTYPIPIDAISWTTDYRVTTLLKDTNDIDIENRT